MSNNAFAGGNQTQATEESLWSMLNKDENEFVIYIPRIQRDYAQGRTFPPSTTQIREQFISDIFEVLTSPRELNKSLDINFIYGNIESDNGKRKFIPIDGQQRLTTLFLLHWYFAMYSKEIITNPIVKKRLLQFQYETRNVTGQFCKNLVEYVRVDLGTLSREKKLSDAIKNYYWFFSDFENDASIKSMLVMLDTIHSYACKCSDSGIDLSTVFDRLCNDSPIHFLYLNIDDVGLTDSIYIKMNARGKALTHFENFKAQLRGYLSSDSTFAEHFIDSVNGVWSEFFWHPEYRRLLKDKVSRETVFDDHMMKFFRFLMYTDYIVNVEEEAVKNSQRIIRDSLSVLNDERDYTFTARLFKDGFQKIHLIEASDRVLGLNTFKKISTLLNILSKRKTDTGSLKFTDETRYDKVFIDEDKMFLRLIGTSEERYPSYDELIVAYAEYAFLIKYANEDFTFDKESELTDWVRLIYNLVKPTLNLQLDIFFRMIRTVDTMVDEGSALTCREFMAGMLRNNYHQSITSIFYEGQVVEESVKAILSITSDKWLNIIIEAENTFLDGEIDMLLSFAGIIDEYETAVSEYEVAYPSKKHGFESSEFAAKLSEQSDYYVRFKAYVDKFKMIFDPTGLKIGLKQNALFVRALLCFGGKNSYLLPPGKPIQGFLDDNDRDYGFRRLFRDENSGRRIAMKELLDSVNCSRAIEEQLADIIKTKQCTSDERWKELFIAVPEVLNCLWKNPDSKQDPDGCWVFERAQRFIRMNSCDDILLLTKTQTNSINRELYSYVLFLKGRKLGLNLSYHADYTDGAEKYAYYTNKNGKEIHIVYQRHANEEQYSYIAKETDDSEVIYYCNVSDMLDYIQKTIK